MIGWHFLIWIFIACSATCFQNSSNVTNELDSVEQAFNRVSEKHHHLYTRNDIIFDPNNLAPQNVWLTAVTNAERLSCLMRRTDLDAGKILQDKRVPPSAESEFNGVYLKDRRLDVLQDWGWNELPVSNDAKRWRGFWGWLDARLALGLHNKRGGDVDRAVRLGHWDPKSFHKLVDQVFIAIDNRLYHSSGAIASFVIDRLGHMIFISGFKSVKSGFDTYYRNEGGGQEFPKLRYLSDLVWLYWRGGGKIPRDAYRDIRYFAVARINKVSSQQIIASALRQRGITEMIPLWPGIVFTREEEAGKALIGSLGMSCAQFLFTHKSFIDIKHIYQVVVFRDTNWAWFPQVIFYIQDVPENLLIPQEAVDWQPNAANAAEPAPAGRAEVIPAARGYERDSNGNYFREHAL